MTGFDERKRAAEGSYKHDMEMQFKIRNRRNKLFGLWLATEHLGLADEAATAYAKDVVMADFELPGDDDIFTKVKADLAAAGKEISDHLLKKNLADCEAIARDQVAKE